jgi:predicted dehydrogenase
MVTRRTTLAALSSLAITQAQEPAIPVVIAGLVHGHAAGFFRRFKGRPEFRIVGIAEPRREVAERYAKEHGLDSALFDTSLDRTLDQHKPQAVMAFSDTFDHRAIIEACAKRKIHVMVEKPLAVSMEHARAIEKAARAAGIHVLVNYETTWYPTVHHIHRLTRDTSAIGSIRKMVVRDGHNGPKEIGVPPEFLEWLTDPKRNGAGALFDFGCYGANIATWLLDGQAPVSVSATSQTFKPEIYRAVDDDATILLTYPKTQVTIQASWNWPYSRKDMDVYGATGYVLAPNRDDLRLRSGKAPEQASKADPLAPETRDEVAYFASVIRGRMKPSGLSSLENNMVVTQILTAARESIASGKAVKLG